MGIYQSDKKEPIQTEMPYLIIVTLSPSSVPSKLREALSKLRKEPIRGAERLV